MMSSALADAGVCSTEKVTAPKLEAALFFMLALLQCLLLWSSHAGGKLLAMALAGAALSLGPILAPLTPRRRAGIAVALGALLFYNLLAFFNAEPDPILWRVFQAGLVFAYGIFLLSSTLALALPNYRLGLFATAVSLAICVPAGEYAIGRMEVGKRLAYNPSVVRWEGGTAPHPILEEYYPPNTVATTYYASNPNNYFTPSDARTQRWHLNLHVPSNGARLSFPGAAAGGRVRVEGGRAEAQAWQVQLNFKGLALESGAGLLLAFRIRADAPRKIGVGVGQNHAPWSNLGLYRDLDVGTAWQDVVIPFNPNAGDEDGRIHFDLGASAAAVEIDGVVVRRRNDSVSIVQPVPETYSVSYRFNDHGCRGDNVDPSAGAARKTILVLGDSYGVGVGVHEADSMPAQLQRLLNGGAAATRYDVVNCSVSGYATTQERQMFEIQAPYYRPSIVIVPMVENDDDSWRADVRNGYFYIPSRYDRLFLSWGAFQAARHLKPQPTYANNVAELRRLNELCKKIGARLVVVAYRNGRLDESNWGVLVRKVGAGLAGTGIVWEDLGDAINTKSDWTPFYVYPGGDFHPNARAHALAAAELARLLKANGLVER